MAISHSPPPAGSGFLVQVDGRSMLPSLEVGWVLRVEPDEAVEAGDIVVIQGRERLIVHRVFHVLHDPQGTRVFQGGDAGGRVTLTDVRDLRGKVVAVVRPEGHPLPVGGQIPAQAAAHFRRTRRRCRVFALLRSLALTAPLSRATRGALALLERVGAGRPKPGEPLAEWRETVSLRLELPAHEPNTPEGAALAEVSNADLSRLFQDSGWAAFDPAELDRASAAPWRCFAALLDGRLAHHSFVSLRPGGALLFRCATPPPLRGRGLFVATVLTIAGALAREGHTELLSSCAGSNTPSLRAHAAAGFAVARRRRELYLLGVNLSAIRRRAWSGARGLMRRLR